MDTQKAWNLLEGIVAFVSLLMEILSFWQFADGLCGQYI
jgi:hypothetical protein